MAATTGTRSRSATLAAGGLALVGLTSALMLAAGFFSAHVRPAGLAAALAAVVLPTVVALVGAIRFGRRWWVLFAPAAVLSVGGLVVLNVVRLGGH